MTHGQIQGQQEIKIKDDPKLKTKRPKSKKQTETLERPDSPKAIKIRAPEEGVEKANRDSFSVDYSIDSSAEKNHKKKHESTTPDLVTEVRLK